MIKRQFKIALASAGLSQSTWAKQHQIVECSLSLVLSGKRKSRRISSLINTFIENEFAKLHITTSYRSKSKDAA